MTEAAYALLAAMDEGAAALNDKVNLLTDPQRFPALFAARAGVAEADGALAALLPRLRKVPLPTPGRSRSSLCSNIPVLLNRGPTLHRVYIQAFQPQSV